MAADLSELTMTELAEVTLGGSGSSSTMPQKQNPVSAGVIAALATHVTALNSSLQASAQHAQQRDGGAWITEWLTVPQLVLGTGAALGHAERMAAALTPNTEQMNATLHSGKGLIFAEALSFALANAMPRPEAQLKTKELCASVMSTGKTLAEAASELFPEIDFKDVFEAKAQLGSASEEARAFAVAVRALA
jgi:3-carboxy-cis,cis-muconate cycloisomerase